MKNVGSTDRLIRIIVGIILLSLLAFLDGDEKYLALLGVVPLFTGLANYCPLYKLLGMNTIKKDEKDR
ncbi:MAG: YgaP family membrane protein [Halanaerobiales bacterium]